MWNFWLTADLLSRMLAVTLLVMSVASWVVIVWKGWLLTRTARAVPKAVSAFWASADFDAGRIQATHWDPAVGLLLQSPEQPVSWSSHDMSLQGPPQLLTARVILLQISPLI